LTGSIRSHGKAAAKFYSLRHEHKKAVEKRKSLQALVDFLKSKNRVLLDKAVNRVIRLRWYRQRVKDLLSDIDVLASESTCSVAPVFPVATNTDLEMASVKVKQLGRQMQTIETTISNIALLKEMTDHQAPPIQARGTASFLTAENERLTGKLQRMTAMLWSAKYRLNVLTRRSRHLTSELLHSRSLTSEAVSRYNALARRMRGTVTSVLQSARAIQEDIHRLTEVEQTQSVPDLNYESLRLGEEVGEGSRTSMKGDSSD
jgi:hypothetical protein